MRTLAAMLCVAALGCGGAATSTVETTSANIPARDPNDLLVGTAACWLGGMWGDVQGETPNERERSTAARCDDVARIGLGSSDRALQLRAHETSAVVDMRAAIERRANEVHYDVRRRESMLRIYDCIESAEHEIMNARRSAHRIARDSSRGIGALSAIETSELPTLQADRAYEDLARVDGGPLDVEAHVFLLWATLDRMRIAQELPVHLKPYVIDDPLRVVFSAPAIALPNDAAKPLPRGAYLVYLTDAAQAARHPVSGTTSDTTAGLERKHAEAMAGIFEGIADQLRGDADRLPESELRRVTLLLVRALDQSRERVGTSPA